MLTIEKIPRHVRKSALDCDSRTTKGAQCSRPPSFWLTDEGGVWQICAQHTYLIEKGRDLQVVNGAKDHTLKGLKRGPEA